MANSEQQVGAAQALREKATELIDLLADELGIESNGRDPGDK